MQATRRNQPNLTYAEAPPEEARTLFVHLNDGYTVEVENVIDLQVTDTHVVVQLMPGETLHYRRETVFYAGFGRDTPPAAD